jgi:hypothetical protein
MSRPLLTVIVFLALCSPFFLFSGGYAFSEKNTTSYLQELENKKIFTEKELSETFNGYKTITRKKFLLWVIKNTKTSEEVTSFNSKNHPFVDIEKNTDIYPYVVMGYLSGGLDDFTEYKKFLPNRGITKIEAISLFFALENININKLSNPNIEKTVKDLPKDEKLKNIILLAIERRYLQVDEENFVYPYNLLTKNEALYLINNYNLELENKNSIKNINNKKISVLETKSSISIAKELIKKKYINNENITNETLDDSAIHGMVENLDDEYSEYLPPKKEEKFNDFINSDEEINEEYAGLGGCYTRCKGRRFSYYSSLSRWTCF